MSNDNHRDEEQNGGRPGTGERGAGGGCYLADAEFLVPRRNRDPQVEGGVGRATTGIFSIPLDCALKTLRTVNCIVCVLPQYKNENLEKEQN